MPIERYAGTTCHVSHGLMVLSDAYIIPVQTRVLADKKAAISPQPFHSKSSGKHSEIGSISAGMYVRIASIPSLDSQEDRHCEKARHALSGCPRWAVEESKPALMRISAKPEQQTPTVMSRELPNCVLSIPNTINRP